jgi:hypothetical protein
MLQNIQHNPQHIRAVLAGPLFIYEFSGPQLLLFLLVLSQYFFIWPGATPRALRQLRNIRRDPPRLVFGEQLGRRSPARLSIGLRHIIGAAAKYSQFCLFEGGQLLRVSGGL